MLQKITIKNYAIIDHVVIEPAQGLNIVTGETGSGKSIILGALSLILGDRADTSVLINKDEKCVVEAVFDVQQNEDFRKLLVMHELDNEDYCIIRREISTGGKSRAFVNDTPVRLDVLNSLTTLLVDLHRQFDHLSVHADNFQMEVLDAVAGNNKICTEYNELYKQYRQLEKKLQTLTTQKNEWQKEADYKQFLLEELQAAALQEDSIENAEKELKILSHAERITNVLQESVYSLKEGEQPLLNQLKRIVQQLGNIEELMPGIKEAGSRVGSVQIELDDIVNELEQLAADVEIDEEKMQLLQDRVDTGYKLLKKHSVQSTAELLDIQHDLEKSLENNLNVDKQIEQIEKQKAEVYQQLQVIGNNLSESRLKISKVFSEDVNGLLKLVGMPNALFVAEVRQLPQPMPNGFDEVNFKLDANKSGNLQPIHKAASGGELSRITLCIKSLVAKAIHLPTLIFDEVDTGISGEAARQVGVLLQQLSQYHQVICITHQPQVAARSNNHLYVYKHEEKSGRIATKVDVLDKEEHIHAIAKMIGGEQPGKAALQNAKELIGL